MNGLRQPGQRPANRCNSGFTLIELMIVVSIIALLIGLLLPAIWNAMTAARNAEVRTEISQLDSAITAFKAEYGGTEPPSSITLHINQSGWNGDPRSKAIIRRIWPQFDFSGTGGGGWTSATTLNGSECLVFFLGGVLGGSGTAPFSAALDGFSKNPALPFASGGNRAGPFYEFDGFYINEDANADGNLDAGEDINNNGQLDVGWRGRLRNVLGLASNVPASPPRPPEYLDPLPGQSNPYVYFSSYDGRGYRDADVAALGTTLTSTYTQGVGSAFKPNTHQIISPGADAAYGTGGAYDGDSYTAPSIPDEDNITNFSSGRLTP